MSGLRRDPRGAGVTTQADEPAVSLAQLEPLTGELVRLEPLALGHRLELFAAASAPEIWRWWPEQPSSSWSRFQAWVEEAIAAADRGEAGFYAVRMRANRALVGTTGYCGIDRAGRAVEVGSTWLAPRMWGKGANAEAKMLLLGQAFERWRCRRVEFRTDVANERSRAGLVAIGARLEGVLRDTHRGADGEWRSTAVYSILADEWPFVEHRLAERLTAGIEAQRRAGLDERERFELAAVMVGLGSGPSAT